MGGQGIGLGCQNNRMKYLSRIVLSQIFQRQRHDNNLTADLCKIARLSLGSDFVCSIRMLHSRF